MAPPGTSGDRILPGRPRGPRPNVRGGWPPSAWPPLYLARRWSGGMTQRDGRQARPTPVDHGIQRSRSPCPRTSASRHPQPRERGCWSSDRPWNTGRLDPRRAPATAWMSALPDVVTIRGMVMPQRCREPAGASGSSVAPLAPGGHSNGAARDGRGPHPAWTAQRPSSERPRWMATERLATPVSDTVLKRRYDATRRANGRARPWPDQIGDHRWGRRPHWLTWAIPVACHSGVPSARSAISMVADRSSGRYWDG